MHRKIKDGTVELKGGGDRSPTEDKDKKGPHYASPVKKATLKPKADVELLEFPKVHVESPDTPIGSEGNLSLKSADVMFQKDDVLNYENNGKFKTKMTLKVTSITGPSKYKIKRLT